MARRKSITSTDLIPLLRVWKNNRAVIRVREGLTRDRSGELLGDVLMPALGLSNKTTRQVRILTANELRGLFPFV